MSRRDSTFLRTCDLHLLCSSVLQPDDWDRKTSAKTFLPIRQQRDIKIHIYADRHETRQYHSSFIRNLKTNKFSILSSQHSVACTCCSLHASHSRARCPAAAWDLLISAAMNLEGLCSPPCILFTIRRGSFHSLNWLGFEAHQSPTCRLINCRITSLFSNMSNCMDRNRINCI